MMTTLRLLLPLFLLGIPLAAQYTTGRIEGSVYDPSASPVAGAKVTLKSLATGQERSVDTGETGLYFFAALNPGRYALTVGKAGFRPVSSELEVLTSQTISLPIRLEVGTDTTSITVVGDAAPELVAFDSTRSVTRRQEELVNLPNRSRDIVNVISLAPGVIPTFNPRGGQLVTLTGAQAGQISANGGRSKASAHHLDFTDANDWEFGGIALGTQPTPDMTQEVKVLTNNWNAEYGVKASAQVIMVTRSGSNQYTGVLYNYLQNAALNSRDYFDRTGRPTPLRQNLFGLAAGGPLVKNRTFLFGSYEGRRTRGAGSTVIANLPTAAARTRADAAIRPVLALLPVPTSPTSNPDIGTLASQLTSPSRANLLLLRGDHYFSPNHSVALRYFQSVGEAFNRLAGGALPGFDATFEPVGRNAMIADNWVINPRTTNELRVAYARSSALFVPETDPATPRYNITGLISFGTVNNWPQGRIFNIYQINDLMTHVRGRHIFKAGFDLRHIQDNSLNDTNRRGVYTFPDLNAFLAATPNGFNQQFGNTYRGFRNYFHGFFVQDDWKITPTLTLNLGFRFEHQGGLSEANQLQSVLDIRTPGTIGAAGSGILGSFRNASPVVEGNAFLGAPRLGFAWNPGNRRLVIRGGWGLFFDSLIFNGLQAGRYTPPTNYVGSLAGAQISGANSFANLFAGTSAFQTALASQVGGFGTLRNLGSIVSMDSQIPNPFAQHISLGVQYRLTNDLVADVSYVGTRGHALTVYAPLNSVGLANRPARATSVADETARIQQFRDAFARQNGTPGNGPNSRFDPRFDAVDYLTGSGNSNYHSLQMEMRKNFGQGLSLRASYTWSKSIDNASDYSPGQNPVDVSFNQDQFNSRAERAVSTFDIPHRLIVSHVWMIPVFRAQKGLMGKALGGWSFSSINQFQSGIPATMLSGPRSAIADINMDGYTRVDRANCNASGADFELGNPASIPALSVRSDPNGSFRYLQPLLGNNGTCGRNTFRMNRLVNFDFTLAKNVKFRERYGVEFRTDFFNIFNVPFLTATGNDWRTVSSPAFGLYNAAGPARRIQMSLRLSF
jgi:hypothetical protein